MGDSSKALDGKVLIRVTLCCPDGERSNMGFCGTALFTGRAKITVQSGGQKPVTKRYDIPGCQFDFFSGGTQCSIVIAADNFVRTTYLIQFEYDDDTTWDYYPQHYYSGTKDKEPSFIKSFYGVPLNLMASNRSNSQAIAAITLQLSTGFFSSTDLSVFHSKYGDSNWAEDGSVSMVNAQNDPIDTDAETQLDIQYVTGMAPKIQSYVWHSRVHGDIQDILQSTLDNNKTFPLVLSISYGIKESAYSTSDQGREKLKESDKLLQALAVKGISVLCASGDSGAYNDQCGEVSPVWPASSPYITAVGATQLYPVQSAGVCQVTEVACNVQTGAAISSGGGFSGYWKRQSMTQDYQKQAIEAYKKTIGNDTSHSLSPPPIYGWSTDYRGYPDISLFGHNYVVVDKDKIVSVDGTSASSPTLAGLITIINDALLNQNKPTLGFLNPLLYTLQQTTPTVYRDILHGSNNCSMSVCCPYGYSAVKGWDPVTGLGSLNFEVLYEAITGIHITAPPRPSVSSTDCTTPPLKPVPVDISFWDDYEIYIISGAAVLVTFCVYLLCACVRTKRRSRKPLLQGDYQAF